MAQYISKAALVAEIKTRIETYNKGYANGDDCRADALETFLHDIDTLEVKEVDLDSEINKYISKNFYGSETLGFFANRTKEEPNWKDIALCAKHFFELGLKANYEENI